MGFSRQEYWSGLPFPSPEIFLTDPEIKPGFPALQVDSLLSEYQGAHAIWIFKMGLIAYNCCDFNPWTFCADRIMWVMASSTLSEVVLGSWLHNWIESLGCSSIHEGFTKAVITSSFAKYTLIFLIFPPPRVVARSNSLATGNTESLERATVHCTFGSTVIHTLDKVLFSSDLRKLFPSFDPVWDWFWCSPELP